jgi:hypothetical protein
MASASGDKADADDTDPPKPPRLTIVK